MKTLQEIKDEYGVSKGFKDWADFCICFLGVHVTDSLDELFVEVAKEALKSSANRFNTKTHCDMVIRESILSESNIPKL